MQVKTLFVDLPYYIFLLCYVTINNSINRQDNIPVSKPTGSIILFITVLFKVSEQNSSFFGRWLIKPWETGNIFTMNSPKIQTFNSK